MIARALSVVDYRFDLGSQPIDNVFPLLIKELIPGGLRGLILVGILASVMSTISALLNSIATLYTLDVHQKWLRPEADERELVRVGTAATFVLVLFSIFYSPLVGKIGGSIFNYFQTGAAYFAVPIATVFLFGFFWRRATGAASLFTLITGIPLGFGLAWLLPVALPSGVVADYGLDNRYIVSGLTQVVCAVLFVIVSLCTRPEPEAAITSLLWSRDCLRRPAGEPRRPWIESIGFWWAVFLLAYLSVYYLLW